MNETIIKEFFSLADTKIKLTKQVKQLYSKELAPNFNSFNFWWIDENTISRILAFFLDPKETHGQGDVYLKHFLTKFGLDFFQYHDENEILVQCEYRIKNDRRIDIVISKNTFEKAIAIENKIYNGTQDQNNQIIDYHDFLEQRTKDEFCLFYLRPGDKTIPEHSIEPNLRDKFMKKGTLKLISYEKDMVECLKEFGKLTENDRVRSFLKDFERTLKKIYMGEKDMNTKQTVTDLINESDQYLKISFLVSNALGDIKNELKNIFERQIEQIGEELGMEITDKLALKPTKWEKHKVAFSFEGNTLLYGIIRKDEDPNKTRLPEIEKLLEEELQEKYDVVAPWWAIWRYAYINLENSPEFWLDVKNGTAKDKARHFVKLINENFNDNKY